MPSQSNTKRSQPMPAKKSDGSSKSSNKTPRGSPNAQTNAPVTTASSATKRVAKAVRSGGKLSSKSKTNNKARLEGPEAERSDEEDDEEIVYPDGGAEDDDEECNEQETTPEPDEKRVSRERVVLGVEGKSVPKKEIGMDALLAGAKSRPESHNITRGYEFITSPASRLIIPSVELKVMGGKRRMVRHDSIASSTAFTDDSEWEKVQFEMDASVDAFSDSESLSLSHHDIGRKKKQAYAEVVKRNYPVPVAAAS